MARSDSHGRDWPTAGPASASAFLRDDLGAVTVEFTVLVPLFVLLLVFFADSSVVYLTHSGMYADARDLARRMSVEELTTAEQVRSYAADHLFLGNRSYTIEPAFGADMAVTISIPLTEAAIFGTFLQPLVGRQLSASATVRREPIL